MQSLTLAYRDDDRMPLILPIGAMASRITISMSASSNLRGDEYEAALFNGAANVIIEHLEYLYDEAARARRR